MAYELKQDLRQSQNIKQLQWLIMSPQMQQALSLLQMPILELSALIEMEIEQNPLLDPAFEEEKSTVETQEKELEEDLNDPVEKELDFDDRDLQILQQLDEDFKDHFRESGSYTDIRRADEDKLQTYLESSIQSEKTLNEHLMQQAREVFSSKKDLEMAEAIIGNLDDNGLLQVPLEEIALLGNFHIDKLSSILLGFQEFDPPGIAATSLQQSLLFQLQRKDGKNTLAYRILGDHFQDLIHNRIPTIQKNLHCSIEDISSAIREDIAKLNLQPGASFQKTLNPTLVPDLVIEAADKGKLQVIITNEHIPTIHLNPHYLKMIQDEKLAPDVKAFIKQKLLSVKWLIKNVEQRNNTLEKIGHYLTETQSAFFLDPLGKLTPLTMKSCAETLQIHESTVARAVANKYLSCNRGIFPLRSFFTNEIETDKGTLLSSKTVKDLIEEMIQKEDKKNPLSDQAISNKIKAQGIHCARRTVAKYRLLLKIGSAQQRKKFD